MKTKKTTKYYHENSDVIAFKRVEEPNGYSSEYTYDKQGNILTFKHSNGSFYERTYDEKGNELTYKDSDGFSYEYTYDKNGNELTFKNSDGDFRIKGECVYTLNRPLVGKKVIVDGIEYELK